MVKITMFLQCPRSSYPSKGILEKLLWYIISLKRMPIRSLSPVHKIDHHHPESTKLMPSEYLLHSVIWIVHPLKMQLNTAQNTSM
jgi:hypothetical protein